MARYRMTEEGVLIPSKPSKTQEALLKEQIELAGLEVPKESACSSANLVNLKEAATLATKVTKKKE